MDTTTSLATISLSPATPMQASADTGADSKKVSETTVTPREAVLEQVVQRIAKLDIQVPKVKEKPLYKSWIPQLTAIQKQISRLPGRIKACSELQWPTFQQTLVEPILEEERQIWAKMAAVAAATRTERKRKSERKIAGQAEKRWEEDRAARTAIVYGDLQDALTTVRAMKSDAPARQDLETSCIQLLKEAADLKEEQLQSWQNDAAGFIGRVWLATGASAAGSPSTSS